MKIYLALDCSNSLILHSTNKTVVYTKLQRALNLMTEFTKEMANKGIDISLIKFSRSPKIVKKFVKLNDDIINSFPKDIISAGPPNFSKLRDIILMDNVSNDFELIILFEASQYNWVPISFSLPCPVRFVLLTDEPNSISLNMISEMRTISMEFCPEKEAEPITISKDDDVIVAAERLMKIKRTIDEATIFLSDQVKMNVGILPGFRNLPIYSFSEQITKRLDCNPIEKLALYLLGPTSSQNLQNLPSSTVVHIVRPLDSDPNGEEWAIFHSFTEALGAQGMVAILQNKDTQEEYVLKPYRDDPENLWMLTLQLIASSHLFTWQQATTKITPKVQFPEVSYKSTATPQIYWTDQQGLQLDITKLHRFLKRTDRVEQFYQEIQRISGNALAFGYHGFASEFANVLDKRCKNVPMECKAHLSRVTDLLRKGGFKLVHETKLIM